MNIIIFSLIVIVIAICIIFMLYMIRNKSVLPRNNDIGTAGIVEHFADTYSAMTAAIFKGTIKNQSFYWICNYRTSKFYPLTPLGKEMRDNKLEMEIGNLLASMGIPLEPHENWYFTFGHRG